MAGTTVAGLGLMEITSSKPFSLPKPSWYLQASILTGVAGGVGYFLMNNKYTPEEIKMDAEDDFTGSEFAAEVFEADRKLRRRTRWTWKKGFEPKYAGHDNKEEYEEATGYDISQTWYKNRYPRGYKDIFTYEPQSTYHISDLPEGYHLHLWKPTTRARSWIAYAKSPSMDEKDWLSFTHESKSGLTSDLLEWYNQDIAKPETAKLNPIQRLAIAKGLKSGEVKLNRVEHPKVEKEIKDNETGDISYKLVTPHIIEYFASGGPDQLEPKKVAEVRGGNLTTLRNFENSSPYAHVIPFLQGLSFLGWKKAGDNRSVNRFNKDAKTWTNVYHAWFKNAVENGITRVSISGVNGDNNVETSWGKLVSFQLNEDSMIRFLNGQYVRRYRYSSDHTMLKGISGNNYLEKATVSVYGKTLPQFEVWTGHDTGWYRPRPNTQQKLYEAAMEEDLNGDWKLNKFNLVNVIFDKYQFEKLDEAKDTMTTMNMDNNASRSRYKDTMRLMCRRFKKK